MQQSKEEKNRLKQNSLLINVIHQVEYINEKKNRVMVMQIENITKPLFEYSWRSILDFFILCFIVAFKRLEAN